MRINTNINSMRTQEYMRQNQAKMSNSMDRLSSGKRINNASDDAAGLAIATRMRARESGLGVAANNTQDGMSLIRTADSAMNSVSNILLRMRDIANQSSNGTNTDQNKAALQKEFSALQKQITYIADNTQFNDKNLLQTDSKINIQTLDSSNGQQQIGIELKSVTLDSLEIGNTSIGDILVKKSDITAFKDKVAGLTTATANDVKGLKESFDKIKDGLDASVAKKLDNAINAINPDSADSGAAAVAELKSVKDAVTYPEGTVEVKQEDLDAIIKGIASLKATSKPDPDIKAIQEAIKNIDPAAIKGDLANLDTQLKAFTDGSGTQITDIKEALEKVNLPKAGTVNLGTTNSNPLDAIAAIDKALTTVADNRATLGATLNRLDFNVNNLKSQASSMASAASQVEDADMAKEMSEMTKFKILNEAGISMLSQANQTPQMVSKLLQ
ncbi:flagellin N-terminal helical domain-containing protein [Bacillus mycoides]|uniref:flagellin N-terminal helical domain-containing protein n=1 Tax=Bacillus mycoides TaxID=1405 RepID=UPI0011EFC674|nr:flagellin [Bacillus mycoides]QEL84440.1 flagellin [Bacillus mycoides]